MKTNCSVQEIRLAEIRINNADMPIGILTDDTGKEIAYLSPFRGYRFQVSATFDGQSDLGASPVFGLNNLLDARLGTSREHGYQSNLEMASIKAYLLKQAAMDAVNSFCQKAWQLEKEYGGTNPVYRVFLDNVKVEPDLGDSRRLPLLFGATTMDRFIGLTIKYMNRDFYKEWSIPVDDRHGILADHRYHTKELETCDESSKAYHQKRLAEIEADAKALTEINKQYTTNSNRRNAANRKVV